MNTLFDNRHAGLFSNFKLVLNCLKHHPNINDWHFHLNNSLYGKGNVWNKFIDQNTSSNSLIHWDQGNVKINFVSENKIKSIDWILGYPSDDRDKYENKEFIGVFKNLIHQIQFKKEILEEVEKHKHLINPNTVGVHVRMRDHLTSGHGYNQEYKLNLNEVIHKIQSTGKDVFIVSDTHDAYNLFSSQIKNVKFIDDKEQYENNKMGLHFLPLSNEEKEKMLKTLLVEVILLSKCSYLYLMNSNVSHVSLFLSDHFNYEFYDKNIIYT